MATKYVNHAAGNNSWDGTSPTFVSGSTGPWATIQKALDTMASGDTAEVVDSATIATAIAINQTNQGGKTLTVRPYNSASILLTFTDTTNGCFKPSGSTFSSTTLVTFDDLDFQAPSTAPQCIGQGIDGTFGVVFSNCNIGSSDDTVPIFRTTINNSKTGNFTFTNVIMDVSAYTGALGMFLNVAHQVGVVTYTGCTFLVGPGDGVLANPGYGMYINQGMAGLILTNNTWTPHASFVGLNKKLLFVTDGTAVIDKARQVGDTATAIPCYGFCWESRVDAGYFADCTISVNAASSGCVAFCIARDGSGLATPPKNVICERMFITHTGSTRSHCLLWGRGLSGGICRKNTLIGGDECLVVKSEGSTITRNICWANAASSHGMIMRSGVRNSITHNIFYSALHDAAQFDHQVISGSNNPTQNVLSKNIFVIGASSTAYCINGGSDAQMDTYVFSENVYYRSGGSGKVANIHSTACTTLADLQARWLSVANRSQYNDFDSVEADPRFTLDGNGVPDRISRGSGAYESDRYHDNAGPFEGNLAAYIIPQNPWLRLVPSARSA